jgi:hypothetical protein
MAASSVYFLGVSSRVLLTRLFLDPAPSWSESFSMTCFSKSIRCRFVPIVGCWAEEVRSRWFSYWSVAESALVFFLIGLLWWLFCSLPCLVNEVPSTAKASLTVFANPPLETVLATFCLRHFSKTVGIVELTYEVGYTLSEKALRSSFGRLGPWGN